MGMFEKYRAKGFFQYVQNYDPENPKTHNCVQPGEVIQGGAEECVADTVKCTWTLVLDSASARQRTAPGEPPSA